MEWLHFVAVKMCVDLGKENVKTTNIDQSKKTKNKKQLERIQHWEYDKHGPQETQTVTSGIDFKRKKLKSKCGF